MKTFDIKEANGTTTKYCQDCNGVIKQLYPDPYVYDAKYSAVYDKPAYKRQSNTLQRMRLGFIEAALNGQELTSVLDCGYGNGAFLQHIKDNMPNIKAYGFDVTDVKVPKGVKRVDNLPTIERWSCGEIRGRDLHFKGNTITPMERGNIDPVQITTFWDCLEHFPDISFIKNLHSEYVAISLPYCHFNSLESSMSPEEAQDWFSVWHHRKPNEHLHHFDCTSLVKTMNMYGWEQVAISDHEDLIRKPRDYRQNILAATFKKKSLI